MTVVAIIAGAILLVAAALTTYRVLAGPNTLDRLLAIDTLVAVAICGLAVWATWSRDTTVVPAIVALSLVGFLGSASVARFRVRDDDTQDEEVRR
ncbi:monovalent cation/H+ antiporter complex subunit F [Aldersonia sp. NBC_00410]|jgi:multicomponent Na+:H+ antiporter subunit F|uniref:monovalent cation/H+ antiporter complex subunit F n=1 Tax=Aldersonia sp. NBC_00410 TaxID=2975954 RepID=UPI0022509F6A|nr:monovalent cation/H+ antiporter complex subunit F [Aldersonia sp. NBC_00410]MCX5041924.1 monovalent cation/H+ antiporter complex subunit F [Aldersonia sp. NBC_00410]